MANRYGAGIDPRAKQELIAAYMSQQQPQRHPLAGATQNIVNALMFRKMMQEQQASQQQNQQAQQDIARALMGGGNPQNQEAAMFNQQNPGELGMVQTSPQKLPDQQSALQQALMNPQALQSNPMLAQVMAQQMGGQKPQLMNVPQGGTLFDPATRRPVYTNPGATDVKPPPTRTYQKGEENVTEQWDPVSKTWSEIGRGSRVQRVEQRTGDLDKKTGSDLREKFFNAQEGLGRLRAIGETFNPEYLTLGGKAKAMKAKWQDFITGDLSPQDQQYLGGYTSWASNAYDNLNRYIKEITGAAMTNAEAGRITKSLPNPESDSPTEFQTKYNTVTQQLKRAVARTRYALTIDKPIENFSLEALDKVIDDRGDQLEKEFVSGGLSQEQAEAAAKKQLKEEFGI